MHVRTCHVGSMNVKILELLDRKILQERQYLLSKGNNNVARSLGKGLKSTHTKNSSYRVAFREDYYPRGTHMHSHRFNSLLSVNKIKGKEKDGYGLKRAYKLI